MNKRSDLSRLLGYAGSYRYLIYASWALAGISALVAFVPFLYIWRILRAVLEAAPDFARAQAVPHYGWLAVAFAVLAMLLYIAGHQRGVCLSDGGRAAADEGRSHNVLPSQPAVLHHHSGHLPDHDPHHVPERERHDRGRRAAPHRQRAGAPAAARAAAARLSQGQLRGGGGRDLLLRRAEGRPAAHLPLDPAGADSGVCGAVRFWDASRGRITVGGMDVSTADPEALLELYAIVFQDVTLFDNTILENIRIGRKDATDEQVLAAAKLANCDEFAARLPDGWNSRIGENGCALSCLIQNKTVLVIAHRMRTVAVADKVVVLADGVVAESGTPAALRQAGGLYARMEVLQAESQRWALG